MVGEPVEKISSTAPMNADSLKGTQQSMITSTAWKLHACRKLCIQAPPRSLTENHPWTQGGFIWASSPSQVGYTPELSSGTVCVGNSKVYRPVKPLNSSHYMSSVGVYPAVKLFCFTAWLADIDSQQSAAGLSGRQTNIRLSCGLILLG